MSLTGPSSMIWFPNDSCFYLGYSISVSANWRGYGSLVITVVVVLTSLSFYISSYLAENVISTVDLSPNLLKVKAFILLSGAKSRSTNASGSTQPLSFVLGQPQPKSPPTIIWLYCIVSLT